MFLIVFMHFIRKYGQSGFKVEMCNRYCSVKEVFSCLYIFSHWVCVAIMTYLVIVDNIIDGNILKLYHEHHHHHKHYVYQSLLTHSTKFAIWYYTILAFYFIVGINNTVLAVELFGDRGRVPYKDPAFTRPDYIGQNSGW